MNIDTKFLLLCLHVIIVLLMSMYVEGMPSLSDSSLSMKSSMRVQSSNNNERAYRLHNECAFRDVLIQDNRVTATATKSDDRGDLILETTMKDNELRIRIRGLVSGRYICYNRRGRLVAKPKKKARGAKCEFIEVPSKNRSSTAWRYMSAYNSRWFMGFDHKRRPLLGSEYVGTDRPSCFQFIKNAHVVTPGMVQNQFNVNKHNSKIGQTHPHLRHGHFSHRGMRTTTTTTSTEPTTTSAEPSTSTTTTTEPPTTTATTTTKTTAEPPTFTTPPAAPILVQGSERVQYPDEVLFNPETHHPLRHHRNYGQSHHAHPRQRHLKKSQRNRMSKSTTWISSTLV